MTKLKQKRRTKEEMAAIRAAEAIRVKEEAIFAKESAARAKIQKKVNKDLLKIPKFMKRKASKHVSDTPLIVESKFQTFAEMRREKAALQAKTAKKAARKKAKEPIAYKPTVQENMRAQISDLIGEIEDHVDAMVNDGCKKTFDFDMYAWLRARGVKAKQTRAIAAYYEPLMQELTEVSSDEQLKEGYSWMTARQLKAYAAFIRSIHTDAVTWASNNKTVKKTRTRKAKTADKQVSKMTYCKDDEALKLVYNVRTHQLGVYNAIDRGGFKIKGSSLKGWEEGAIWKRIRKPAETLAAVLAGKKVALRKILSAQKSKETEMTGRFSKQVILLKVVK